MTFAERYGSWAVVTGAARGIGAAFASELAARGVRVLGVDRDPVPDGLAVDLASPDAASTILDRTKDLDVGLFVSNAAAPAPVGPFLDRSLDTLLTEIDVNCRVPLELIHAILPRLVERGRGGIVLLSSGAALRGSALVSHYAATKAWNLILAESLWDEVREHGVDVMAVLPGNTRTPGWLSARPQPGLATVNVMDPADVAREALDALGSVPSIQPGRANRDAEATLAKMDRAEAVRIVGRIMRQTFPPDREPAL